MTDVTFFSALSRGIPFCSCSLPAGTSMSLSMMLAGPQLKHFKTVLQCLSKIGEGCFCGVCMYVKSGKRKRSAQHASSLSRVHRDGVADGGNTHKGQGSVLVLVVFYTAELAYTVLKSTQRTRCPKTEQPRPVSTCAHSSSCRPSTAASPPSLPSRSIPPSSRASPPTGRRSFNQECFSR